MVFRLLLLLLFIFPACAFSASLPDQLAGTVRTVQGQVTLSGVAVSIQVQGRFSKNATFTSDAGTFSISLKEIFPGLAAGAQSSITLIFEKDNFDKVIRIINTGSAAQDFENLEIAILQLSGTSVISADEAASMADYYSTKGRTLFLFPYHFSGSENTFDMNRFAGSLSDRISDGLRPWLQALPGVDFDVSIQPLEELPLSSTNLEKVHALGKHLNALAMVSGGGEFEDEPDGSANVFLRSRYVTIPALEKLRPGTVKIDDRFPKKILNSMRLGERLNRHWEVQSALAICVREFERALADGKRESLEKVSRMIVAARSEIGPDDPMQAEQFRMLRDLVNEELGK